MPFERTTLTGQEVAQHFAMEEAWATNKAIEKLLPLVHSDDAEKLRSGLRELVLEIHLIYERYIPDSLEILTLPKADNYKEFSSNLQEAMDSYKKGE